MRLRTKITLKVNKIEPNIPRSHETLNLDNFSKKRNSKNLFNFDFYAERAFWLYHLHYSAMKISIGQNCLNKKTHLSI